MTADGVVPYRINRGGDRQANPTLYPTVVTLNCDRQTKAYTLLRTGLEHQGLQRGKRCQAT